MPFFVSAIQNAARVPQEQAAVQMPPVLAEVSLPIDVKLMVTVAAGILLAVLIMALCRWLGSKCK